LQDLECQSIVTRRNCLVSFDLDGGAGHGCVLRPGPASLGQETEMSEQDHDEVRGAVRDVYGKVAKGATQGGCTPGCCATPSASIQLGYTSAELDLLPEGANMGLGCGNPRAIAALRAGETVLDLGSGGGIDCFLAARQVGPTGRVIGVDMTPDMVSKARANARKVEAKNVDFRLGEIEHLPVADAQVDVILSNCVGKLSGAWEFLPPTPRRREVSAPPRVAYALLCHTGPCRTCPSHAPRMRRSRCATSRRCRRSPRSPPSSACSCARSRRCCRSGSIATSSTS
jgi:hypothetical protein